MIDFSWDLYLEKIELKFIKELIEKNRNNRKK